VEVTPIGLEGSPCWGLLPWEGEWAPNATRNLKTGRLVLLSMLSGEYHGPDYILMSGGLATFTRCEGDFLQMWSSFMSSATRRRLSRPPITR
jgi:hypothetical protein